jgi:hypothetical protein
MWAMALSKSPVIEEFEKALGDMVSMRAVIQAAMSTIVVLLVLPWVIHEEWQISCMIADQPERDAEFVQRADLEPPG